MQILNVKAENFKGLKLVEIEPQKTTTVVGGKNRQGKSSLLDAIASTLGGQKLCPKRPIREGQAMAKCEIKLEGDESRLLSPCTVVRTWIQKKERIVSELEITTDDGFRAPTPQTILNDIVGPLGFDPERFLRMKTKEQSEILRNLVGLDFSKLDAERQVKYDKRTEVNRSGKTMAARYDVMPWHEDAPEEEVSVSALMTELQRRQAVNRRNEEVRGELADIRMRAIPKYKGAIEAAELDIKALEEQISHARERREGWAKKLATATGDGNVKAIEVNSLKDEFDGDTQRQITESETVNRMVRENAERAKLETELEAERAASAALSDRIKEIDATKQTMREEAKWPVENLGYDDNGVTLMDRPLEQASATEQREAAFGIVAALNPTLKFAMIKDGGLLDEDSLVDFSRIAAEKGFQLFVERVGEGKECTVILSEGEIEKVITPEEEERINREENDE